MARHTGVLIKFIADENIKIFAEIGIQFGTNLTKILSSSSGPLIKEYWAIDSWGIDAQGAVAPYFQKWGWIQTAKDWLDLYEGVCQQMSYLKQLRVIKLHSIEAAKLFPNEYFDMVYIDADHSYPAVTQDIKAWFPKVKNGGILGGHDYNKPSVRKAVDEQLTGVWEPPRPEPRKNTKIWLKRRQKTDKVEQQPVFKPVTKNDLWVRNR